jgi:hypothetical protein
MTLPVVKQNERTARRVLNLRQPNLGDEASGIGQLVTEPDAPDHKPGWYIQRFVNDFVTTIRRCIAGRSRFNNQS